MNPLPVGSGAPLGEGAGLDVGRPRLRGMAGWSLGLGGLPKRVFRGIADDFVAIAFPGDCRVCEAPLVRATSLPVCEACRVAAAPQIGPLCETCGEALDIDLESMRMVAQLPEEALTCAVCRETPPMFARAVAYAVYDGTVREMVHLLKYERMEGVAEVLGGMLAEAVLTLRDAAAQELTVVPVPLFAPKERQRGYNQAVLLAEAGLRTIARIAPEWKLQLRPGVLRRVRDTESQFGLGTVGRRRNVRGAFAVDADAMKVGGEVLLIDDIYTTGATARECARVLRRAGASKVWVATVARAQVERVALWQDGMLGAARGFG